MEDCANVCILGTFYRKVHVLFQSFLRMTFHSWSSNSLGDLDFQRVRPGADA